MKTPKEKYLNDPEYNHLVNMFESLIERAHFTPSEIREAAILACINYEMKHIRDFRIDPRIKDSLNILDDFISGKRR